MPPTPRSRGGGLPLDTIKPPALRRDQFWTLALLVLGYTAYYFCRANFSVAKPALIQEIAATGNLSKDAAKEAIGAVASWGTLAYAFGKFVAGGLADRWGGRRNLVTGMIGAGLATVLFATGGSLPVFTTAWVLNRAVQSLGWPGMVKVASRWFPYTSYGFAAGVLSLSYLFGDAAARQVYGTLFAGGMGWRGIYWTAAGVMAAVLVLSAVFLREAPVGDAPEVNPDSVYGEEAAETRPVGLGALLAPLVRSPLFWTVCIISLCLTLVRDTFNEWSPTYFVEYAGLSKDQASSASALFPFLGGIGVLLAGGWSDRLGKVGRAAIMLGGMLVSAVLLAGLYFVAKGSGVAVWLVAAIGFTMIGPYSYLAGAVALDFGGRRGGATASGIIDGVGYLAGVLAGKTVAQLSVSYGWNGAFLIIAGVMVAGCVAAGVHLGLQRRPRVSAS